MLYLTLYCKSHRRRPIHLGARPVFRDAQADIPPAWCAGCGCEIFAAGQTLCSRCHGAKGAK